MFRARAGKENFNDLLDVLHAGGVGQGGAAKEVGGVIKSPKKPNEIINRDVFNVLTMTVMYLSLPLLRSITFHLLVRLL